MTNELHRCADRFAGAAAALTLTLFAGIGGAGSARAQGMPAALPEQAGAAALNAPTSGDRFAAPSDPIRARIERLSEHETKLFYLGCSRAAARGGLASGERTVCSVGYDVLLKRHFGGDFEALLAWSRQQRDATATD